jgi:hypothetical protein
MAAMVGILAIMRWHAISRWAGSLMSVEITIDRAIVAKLELHPSFQASLTCTFSRNLQLLRGQRYTSDLYIFELR